MQFTIKALISLCQSLNNKYYKITEKNKTYIHDLRDLFFKNIFKE